jgi:hypothetical protein
MRVAASIAIVTSLAGAAHAQNAEAELMFQEGDRLMSQGKTAEACTAFEGSNRIETRAGTLIRLGECREKNGQLASAWSAFKDALTRVKDPRKREIAQQAVTSLEPRISKLTLNVPAESRVPGLTITRSGARVDDVLWNREVPVDGGEYEITASAPGLQSVTVKVTVAVASDRARVDIPVLQPPSARQEPAVVVEKAPIAPIAETPAPSMFTTRRKIAVGVVLVGVGGFALGSVFGVQAKDLEDEAFTLCPDPDDCAQPSVAQAKLDSASNRAMLSNVMFGVGILGVAGAAVLWFTGAPESSSIAVRPTASSTQVGLAIEGLF